MNLSNDLLSQKLEAYLPNEVSIGEYDRAANFFNKNYENFFKEWKIDCRS